MARAVYIDNLQPQCCFFSITALVYINVWPRDVMLRHWLRFKRLRVWLPAVPLWKVVHTHCLCSKQYNLVPAIGQWWPVTGKVTVGLASCWPYITDLSGLSSYGKRSPHQHSLWGMVLFSVRCNMYILRLCHDASPSVCLSVCPSVCDVCALWSQGVMDPGYLCILG